MLDHFRLCWAMSTPCQTVPGQARTLFAWHHNIPKYQRLLDLFAFDYSLPIESLRYQRLLDFFAFDKSSSSAFFKMKACALGASLAVLAAADAPDYAAMWQQYKADYNKEHTCVTL